MNNYPPYHWDGTYESILNHGPPDNPYIMQLKSILNCMYKVTIKVTDLGPYGLFINNVWIIRREKKHGPVLFSDNCKLIFGTPTQVGGSIKYPTPGFVEGYCIVEVVTESFPHMDLNTYRNKIEILSLIKIP